MATGTRSTVIERSPAAESGAHASSEANNARNSATSNGDGRVVISDDEAAIDDTVDDDDTIPERTRKKRDPVLPLAVEAKRLLDALYALSSIVEAVECIAGDDAIGDSIRRHLITIGDAAKLVHSDFERGTSRLSKLPQLESAHSKVTQQQKADDRRRAKVAEASRKKIPPSITRLREFIARSAGVAGNSASEKAAGTKRRISTRPAVTSGPSVIVVTVKRRRLTVPAPCGNYYSENEIIDFLNRYSGTGHEFDLAAAALIATDKLRSSFITREKAELKLNHVIQYYCERSLPECIDDTRGYGKVEAISYLAKFDGKEKKARIDAMLGTGKLPSSFSCVYDDMSSFKRGVQLREYGEKGRQSKASIAAVTEQAKQKSLKLKACERDDIQEITRTESIAALKARGISTMNHSGDVSITTATSNLIGVAMTGELSASEMRPRGQEEMRKASCESLRMTDSQLLVMCAAQHISGTKPNKNWDFFDESKLSDGAKKTIARVREARDVDAVYPVHLMLTLTTDETAAFVIAGIPGTNKYRLRLIDPKQNFSTHNLRCEKDWRSMGCRLKYLMTFNGFGMVAPLFITVTCNASELPPEMSPDGVLLGTVPGLCPASANSPNAEGVGYVLLLRADADAPVTIARKKVQLYLQYVLLPFIEECRRAVMPDWDPEEDVPEHGRAVSWSDGDIAMMQEMVSMAEELLGKKIWVAKHGGKCSGRDQFADLMRCFVIIKEEVKRISAEGLGDVGFYGTVESMFKGWRDEKKIAFEYEKERAIRDGIKIAPQVTYKACERKIVQKGWKEGGYDFETGCVNEIKILSNIQRKVDPSEELDYERTWTERYNMVAADGQVTEAMYDRCGFRQGK